MSLDSTFFFYLSAIGYFAAFICYLMNATTRPSENQGKPESPGQGLGITAQDGLAPAYGSVWGRWATRITIVTVALSTVGVVLRTIALSRSSEMFMPLPVSNTYETLAFFSWAIPLAYLFFEWRYRLKTLGIFATGIAFLLIALGSSPLVPKEVSPLVPALQSYWLVAHVLFTLSGEALFSLAFAASLVLLWRAAHGQPWESLKRLDEISYRAVAVGFPLFTLGGLVFGAIWAQRAWGRYWSWDPKEVWTLITWLIYALYLHGRVRWGWQDRRTAWLLVIGYVASIFTWFGVNYLLPGLHSYAG